MGSLSGGAIKYGRRTYSYSDMQTIFDCTRVALWRRVRNGEIPEPVKFGRAKTWDADFIDSHLDRRFSESSGEAA